MHRFRGHFWSRVAKYDFGDYLAPPGRSGQIYGCSIRYEDALSGNLRRERRGLPYAEWFSDPAEARLYSESQHAGSLGPARQLVKALDLSGLQSALLVCGRWLPAPFAITFCKAFPELGATVVDFPNVAAIGREFVDKAGLGDRIHYIEADGLKADWPRNQDVILMSYLLSGIPGETHEGLIKRAYDHLAPGVTLLIHDFIVCADRTGPKLAALWQFAAHGVHAAGPLRR